MNHISVSILITLANSSLLTWDEPSSDWSYSNDNFRGGAEGLSVYYVQSQEECDFLDKHKEKRTDSTPRSHTFNQEACSCFLTYNCDGTCPEGYVLNPLTFCKCITEEAYA